MAAPDCTIIYVMLNSTNKPTTPPAVFVTRIKGEPGGLTIEEAPFVVERGAVITVNLLDMDLPTIINQGSYICAALAEAYEQHLVLNFFKEPNALLMSYEAFKTWYQYMQHMAGDKGLPPIFMDKLAGQVFWRHIPIYRTNDMPEGAAFKFA